MFIPWREDCGTYRNWNPLLGQSSNGLSSSDLSRLTGVRHRDQSRIYLSRHSAGKQYITVAILQGVSAVEAATATGASQAPCSIDRKILVISVRIAGPGDNDMRVLPGRWLFADR